MKRYINELFMIYVCVKSGNFVATNQSFITLFHLNQPIFTSSPFISAIYCRKVSFNAVWS